jgi:hypothetical protein
MALWLLSQIDASAKHIWTATAAIASLATLFTLNLDDMVLVETAMLAWILVFAGFLLARLPGRNRYGYLVATGGIGLSLVPTYISGHAELFAGFLVLWLVPFAITSCLKRALPVGVGVGIGFLFFGGAGLFIADYMSTSISAYQANLPYTIGMTFLSAVFWIPWLTAILMSLLKVNFSDALKALLKPIPLLALVAAMVFAENVRTQFRMEKLWKATSEQELPIAYRQLMDD